MNFVQGDYIVFVPHLRVVGARFIAHYVYKVKASIVEGLLIEQDHLGKPIDFGVAPGHFRKATIFEAAAYDMLGPFDSNVLQDKRRREEFQHLMIIEHLKNELK